MKSKNELINEISEMLHDSSYNVIVEIYNTIASLNGSIDIYEYLDYPDCIKSGKHLVECDDDGFCNLCGYQ